MLWTPDVTCLLHRLVTGAKQTMVSGRSCLVCERARVVFFGSPMARRSAVQVIRAWAPAWFFATELRKGTVLCL